MRIFGPEDVLELRQRVLRAERITGFNVWAFDFPVIFGVSKQDWLVPTRFVSPYISDLRVELLPKTNDLLRRIWCSLDLDPDRFQKETHGGLGLGQVTAATLGVTKIGYGGDAPRWFQEGHWEKIANYCADDVALTRDLSDFIDSYWFIIDPRNMKKLCIFT